jgi:hypothetical protein
MPQFFGAYSGFRTFSDATSMHGWTSSNYIVLIQLLIPVIGFNGDIIPDRTTRDKVQVALADLCRVMRSVSQKNGFNEVLYSIAIINASLYTR